MKNLDLWRRSWPDFEALFSEMDLPMRRLRNSDFNFSPTCEVEEDRDHYLFKFDLPGMDRKNVSVEVHENQLIVSGERRQEEKHNDKKTHFSEISYGKFQRSFMLPNGTDSEKVKATFNEGVLRIEVAKSNPAKPREIAIS